MKELPLSPTLATYLSYCKEHEDAIFFRVKREEKWESLALSELTPEEWGEKVAGLFTQGRTPCRVLSEEEVKERIKNDQRKSQAHDENSNLRRT